MKKLFFQKIMLGPQVVLMEKKKVKLISYPIQYPRINSNFFRDLNMKDRTIKLS